MDKLDETDVPVHAVERFDTEESLERELERFDLRWLRGSGRVGRRMIRQELHEISKPAVRAGKGGVEKTHRNT